MELAQKQIGTPVEQNREEVKKLHVLPHMHNIDLQQM
jgi:hypothetical protein